jgi:hypothetical protein
MECVARAPAVAQIRVRLRFLQYEVSERAVPREVCAPLLSLDELARRERSTPFAFAPIAAEMSVAAAALHGDLYKLTVRVCNRTTSPLCDARDREAALSLALVSPTLDASIAGGSFVSLVNPPAPLREVAAGCRNSGTWPVLVGDRAAQDTLLCAPIILEDYPQIAPESAGDFFDGTDIDEMLTLRVLTLSDGEKREVADAGGDAQALLQRTEDLGQERMRTLHGRLSRVPPLRPGVAVRLRPQGRADIFDLALAGKRATIDAVEQDLEGRTYVAVTVDDDPGKDLGIYGHRFFFRPEEVEVL